MDKTGRHFVSAYVNPFFLFFFIIMISKKVLKGQVGYKSQKLLSTYLSFLRICFQNATIIFLGLQTICLLKNL